MAGPQKETIIFQPSIYRCELLVSGRVYIYIYIMYPLRPDIWICEGWGHLGWKKAEFVGEWLIAKQMAQLQSTNKYMAQFLPIWGWCLLTSTWHSSYLFGVDVGPLLTYIPLFLFFSCHVFWPQGIGVSQQSTSSTWPSTNVYSISLYPNKTPDLSLEAGSKL